MQFININNTMYNKDHIVGVEMPQYDTEDEEWYFAVIITNEIAEFVIGDNAEDCMRKRTSLLLELETTGYVEYKEIIEEVETKEDKEG